MRISLIRAVKARTSCNARAETPEETPLRPYLHARSPRASRNGAGAASRACSVISQWPVAPHHMTLPTNARRPRSRLLVARWSLPRLVCSAWLLAVEASHPDQAFRYASACEGLLRRMLSPGGSLNGDPPPLPLSRLEPRQPSIRDQEVSVPVGWGSHAQARPASAKRTGSDSSSS